MRSGTQKITLIFLFSTLFLLTACNLLNSDKRLHVLHFENSVGEKGITTSKYDDTGLNIGAKWELLDGSRWSENYHNYDENGNMVLKYREFSDGLISYNWYTYNENNQLLKEKFFRSDSIQGVTYFNYAENGRLSNMDCHGFNGWLHGLIEMKYDEKGLKTSASILKDGNEIGSINYEYENGLLINEIWDFNQKYSQTLSYEYVEYEKPNRQAYPSSNVFITNTYNYKVVLEEYDYNNQGGGPSHFEYDEEGKLVKKIFTRADGLQTITDFEYDENGLLAKSIRNYNSGEKGIFNYKFNGNRQLIEKTFSLPNNVQGYEKYEYNGKFQLVKAKLKNFDKWITGTIDFVYNEEGKLIVGYFKGEQFDAEINFTVDENNNVTQYIWVLSYGATQTYSFTYEEL